MHIFTLQSPGLRQSAVYTGRWRLYVPPKRLLYSAGLHGVTSQEILHRGKIKFHRTCTTISFNTSLAPIGSWTPSFILRYTSLHFDEGLCFDFYFHLLRITLTNTTSFSYRMLRFAYPHQALALFTGTIH
jgi:hypothetical protein